MEIAIIVLSVVVILLLALVYKLVCAVLSVSAGGEAFSGDLARYVPLQAPSRAKNEDTGKTEAEDGDLPDFLREDLAEGERIALYQYGNPNTPGIRPPT